MRGVKPSGQVLKCDSKSRPVWKCAIKMKQKNEKIYAIAITQGFFKWESLANSAQLWPVSRIELAVHVSSSKFFNLPKMILSLGLKHVNKKSRNDTTVSILMSKDFILLQGGVVF